MYSQYNVIVTYIIVLREWVNKWVSHLKVAMTTNVLGLSVVCDVRVHRKYSVCNCNRLFFVRYRIWMCEQLRIEHITHQRWNRCGAVGWGTALQVRRLRVRFPMVPMKLFHWRNPFGRTITEMSTTTNICWEKRWVENFGVFFIPTRLWRWNRQSVPKRWPINFRRRGISQKKSIQHSEHGESLKSRT